MVKAKNDLKVDCYDDGKPNADFFYLYMGRRTCYNLKVGDPCETDSFFNGMINYEI